MTDQDHSPDWLKRLYEAKAAGLILYGRALGLSHGEAEDVLQDTFMGLMRLPASPSDPEGYCVRAYRNRLLNYRRGFWRRLTRELESRRWFDRDSGESSVERAAMRELAQLPPEQREAIVLKIWHGQTFDGIAALTGVSPNTAAGRYRYGLRRIRRHFKENSDESIRSIGSPVAIVEAARSIG